MTPVLSVLARLVPVLLAALALPAPAGAGWTCGQATYASETCPWFGEAGEGLAAPTVAMRWSSDGYHPESAVGRWNDGIYAIVSLPRAGSPDGAALRLDVAYEPHWQPREARDLRPAAVILRLEDEHWRADVPAAPPRLADGHHWLQGMEGRVSRFAFGPGLVAAMLAASDAAPHAYRDLFLGEDPSGVLHVENLFRDVDGNSVSSNDIVGIDSARCEANCLPRLSLAGFAEAYRGSTSDADE